MLLSLAFLKAALPEATFVMHEQGSWNNVHDTTAWLKKDEEVGVAFDSREVMQEDLFVAFKGQTVDAHSFLKDVLDKGAVALLVSDLTHLQALAPQQLQNRLIILVADTYQAFIALARAWRKQLTMPIVAITGSVGKTTTKEMLRSIFAAAGRAAYVSLKNQNTVVGVCATILNVKSSDSVAACEVGISLQGEMAERIEILRPTIAAITNIGHAHIEGLGGITGVVREKRQIFKFFEPHNIGIINGDQDVLAQAHYPHPIAKVGFKAKNQVQAKKVTVSVNADGLLVTHFMLKFYSDRAHVALVGGHVGYVSNALTAAAIAYFLNIDIQAVVQGLESYRGFEGRFEIHQIKKGIGRLISDCYNANPESMRAAIEAFSAMPALGKKVAVLGDMLGLGDKAVYWNRQVGRMIAKAGNIDQVILVGKFAAEAQKTLPFKTHVVVVPTWREAVPMLEYMLASESSVLVKGSRDVGLKNLVAAFI